MARPGPAGRLVAVTVVVILVLVGVGFASNEFRLPQAKPKTTTVVQSSSSSGGLYISGVRFAGGNVTVTLGNSGGGVPTPPGYGDTGTIARYVGALIIQKGPVYYHYNWNCQLGTPCALAPGPDRYFSLARETSDLNAAWNLGNASIVPDILSVGGTLSAVMTFPWTSGGSYTFYVQSNDGSIVCQASFTAPG